MTSDVVRLSSSVEQTQSIAAELAATLAAGDCVALDGELGAGKTQFVRGLASALGCAARSVSSPTYVLLNVYTSPKLSVYHLDAYRIHGPADFEAIGFSELLDQKGIVVVEWAQKVADLLPPRRVDVQIDILDETDRRITLRKLNPTPAP